MMPMKPSLESIRIKYDLQRIYFTLYIPIILAILLVTIPFAMGITGLAQPAVNSPENTRLQAYEQLVQSSGEETGAPVNAGNQAPALFIPLDYLIIFGVLIAITPYAIDMTIYKKRQRQKEELFAEFLFKLSELMRGGLDPVKSVMELSRTEMGPLTPHLQIAATGMIYGKTFSEAMHQMAGTMGSDLIRRYIDLIIQASTSGGSTADLILRASEDMRSIIAIEREKEGNLSQYTFIFYFAQAILLAIAYILSSNLISYIQQLGSTTIFGENQLADLDFRQGFFHLLMINSFFGGLIIGKISEGEARYGLKHAVILMVTCFIACSLFILPVPRPEVAQNLSISLVSGDKQQGIPGFPLQQPIDFRVNDLNGNPQQGITVAFAVLPNGTASPSQDVTDDKGIASVKVTLGSASGNYLITARAGNVTAQATAEAIENG